MRSAVSCEISPSPPDSTPRMYHIMVPASIAIAIGTSRSALSSPVAMPRRSMAAIAALRGSSAAWRNRSARRGCRSASFIAMFITHRLRASHASRWTIRR